MRETATISLETEIHITPDGRVLVFGMSREVLEVLASLCPNDHALQRRLQTDTRSRTVLRSQP